MSDETKNNVSEEIIESSDRTEEKVAMLEAILFTTDHPLSVKQISRKLRVRETTVIKILKILE